MKLNIAVKSKMVLILSFLGIFSTHAQEVAFGSLTERQHDVNGQVVALSERVLEIRNFQFDGMGPAVYFWLDTNPVPSSNGVGLVSPYNENCGVRVNRAADGTDTVRVELAENDSLLNYAGGSFSVWCEQFDVSFGDVVIPNTLEGLAEPSAVALECFSNSVSEIPIGSITERQHDVNGEVVALSERVLELRNFQFDGMGPAVYFWLDTNPVPSSNGVGLVSPYNDNCGVRVNRAADGTVTVRVELAEGDSLLNYAGGSFSVWCEQFGVSFGDVVIPASLEGLAEPSAVALECAKSSEIPSIAKTPDGFNCEPITDDFQVRWQIDGDSLNVELVALNMDDGEYLAFGVSGSDTETQMIGADTVVADIDDDGNFRARDIYMGQRAQCSNANGVCPEGELGTFTEDATNVSGESDLGVTVIRYTRPLTPTDIGAVDVNGADVDRSIPIEGDTFIAWAIGPISPNNGFPNFHTVYPGSTGEDKDYTLNFGRDIADNCNPLIQAGSEDGDPKSILPFNRPVLNQNGDVTEFTAHIGPSGGPRGYEAISGGRVPWGISWYINGVIVPEIELRRGTTYRFLINGGDDETQSSQFHPFYITDSIKGGYAGLSPADRLNERVFAGIDIITATADGVTEFEAPAKGPICLYGSGEGSSDAVDNLLDFSDYFATLDDSCARDESITSTAAILEFTPDEDTPDLLYYQCVTHQNLGWKIKVVNADGTSASDSNEASSAWGWSTVHGFFWAAFLSIVALG